AMASRAAASDSANGIAAMMPSPMIAALAVIADAASSRPRTNRPAITTRPAADRRSPRPAIRPKPRHMAPGPARRNSADRVVRRERGEIDEVRHGGADID